MKKDRQHSVGTQAGLDRALSKRQGRRQFLLKTGGILAAGAFAAVAMRGCPAASFARASQFALAQLRMSRLVSDKPKVAVVFENTAFGTSTSNGLREQAAAEGVEIVLFEPYSAGFTDASPLINKVKSSGANALFSVSYLNDLILIVRTVKQVGLNIAINRGPGGFVIPHFYKNVGKLSQSLPGEAHSQHPMNANHEKVNAEYQK